MFKFFFPLMLVFGICQASEKTIVVTGASGELGGAIAKVLAWDSDLILTGRNLNQLELLQKQLQEQHPHRYTIMRLDYTNQGSIQDFEKKIQSFAGSIAGMVLITPRPQFGQDLLQGESEWADLFQSTFTGPLMALKGVLPALSSRSKIVVIGGISSVQVMPEYGPACIIRRMWTTCVKALSRQLGAKGIHINVLSPGVVLTEFHQERIAKKAQEKNIGVEEEMALETAQIPFHRFADPNEIGRAVQFLLSNHSDYISGVNLIDDGGVTVSY
jgi:3-oxoacyl-[acyl-carrier protein] reductase